MRYSLQYAQDAVVAYLRDAPGLSRADRVRIYANLHLDLAVNAETYRNDPTRRMAPGSPYFRYDIFFRRRVLRFWVSDASAAVGVLEVAYAEFFERTGT